MSDTTNQSYQVLARKYRPETFADLVGQDAMVRTLKNAFAADRIAQAFIMTGIRGTGKTTTARIIAKGMNCIVPDGQGGPTTDPCGVCEHCSAIIEGRHVDVMEMDAASRTGVDDIREIIDSVHYRAASARYKIYIIDEVHMLSTNAFNALLKTLEEPPAHVKFIFATTEIRKVPVTVLAKPQNIPAAQQQVPYRSPLVPHGLKNYPEIQTPSKTPFLLFWMYVVVMLMIMVMVMTVIMLMAVEGHHTAGISAK